MKSLLPSDENLQEIQHALRSLGSPSKSKQSFWLRACLVTRKLTEKPQLAPYQAVKEVFSDVLALLENEAPHLADLLRGRYWEKQQIKAMLAANRPLAQSARQFHNQHNDAFHRFALLLWQQEELCQRVRSSNPLLQYLPNNGNHQLFGIDSSVEQTMLHLREPHTYIIAIKGIGGIGKTTLAQVLATRFIQEHQALHGVAWITAKQEYLTASGIRLSSTRITLENIFDELGSKLGITELFRYPLAEKVTHLAALLRAQSILVVIDNLETVEDVHLLLPWLERLMGPTKFLLTSREAIPSLIAVRQIDLTELNQADSLALIAYVAQEKHVTDLEPQAVYQLLGGNPLAIILTVSQMKYLPPSEVLKGLRHGSIDDLYTYIYKKSWSVLSRDAQETLLALQRVGDRADWAWLTETLDFAAPQLHQAVRQLSDLSLVQSQQESHERRVYTIHRLTSTFLRTEVLGWKTGLTTN